MSYGSKQTPTEIRQKSQEKKVIITWSTGETFEYTMEYLRVKCPCAECCGHTPDQAKLIDGQQNVTIRKISPVGHYAVKFVFSDNHDSGVYAQGHVKVRSGDLEQGSFCWSKNHFFNMRAREDAGFGGHPPVEAVFGQEGSRAPSFLGHDGQEDRFGYAPTRRKVKWGFPAKSRFPSGMLL